MTMFLLVFGFMLLMVAAMAIGVIFGRQPISGSCGGMKALGMDVGCEICGGDPTVCETENGLTKRVMRSLGSRPETSLEDLAKPAVRPDQD